MKVAKIYFDGNLVNEIEHDTIKRLVDFEMNTKEFYLYLNEKEVAFFGIGYSFITEEIQQTKCMPYVFGVPNCSNNETTEENDPYYWSENDEAENGFKE